MAALLLCAPATAPAQRTTVDTTVQDRDGDNLLEAAPGDDYEVFGAPDGFRPPRDGSILNFLQLSDFQTVDEESPARVEFLDFTQRGFFRPFSAAYRPQESLTTQVTESMVRAARNTTSPVTGERLDLTILTGDNADSQQYNETRWFVDILDGTAGPRPAGLDERIDPDSGRPVAGCEATPGSRYDGVRDGGQTGVSDSGYYEPDSSAGTRDDGDGYNPRREDNQLPQEGGADVTVRDFPGLFERANEPFEAIGLDMPWYSAFGNHDALVQGNSPRAYLGPGGTPPAVDEISNPAYQAIATGCVKVMQPSSGSASAAEAKQAAIEALKDAGGGFAGGAAFDQANALTSEVLAGAFAELERACPPGAAGEICKQAGAGFGGTAEIVPPDERRCFLAKDERQFGAPFPCSAGSWISQHFRTTGTPVGHGFAPTDPGACAAYPDRAGCEGALTAEERAAGLGRPPQAVANHDGYYSFSPGHGLRFVVLDTVTDECGTDFCSEGSVDDGQFEWLRDQLRAARTAGQYVLLFSHHTLRTTRQPSTDATEQPLHYGQRVDRKDGQPQNPASAETLEELYCQFPNVLGHVNGHEHENYVLKHDCSQARTERFPQFASDAFYEVSTAAHIDWPQQSRMIELVDNGDNTMSLVLTILDHDGAPNPGGAPADDTAAGQAGPQPVRLSSIARELSYNDYQSSRGARGGEGDRNVIIRLDRPPPPEPDEDR